MAWMKTAPEYAIPYIKTGMFVRIHNEECCYLYHKTSRRIPGRKNPVPFEKYLGKITKSDGFIPCTHRLIETSSLVVREYGWSRAIQLLVPESWKRVAGENWEDLLSAVIVKASPLSFVSSNLKNPIPKELESKVKTQTTTLFRRLRDERKITSEELEPLKSIFIVSYGRDGQKFLSNIDESQQALLSKLNIQIQLEMY